MFQPPGASLSELGDIEIVVHQGRLHLFHLCLPNHDRIAHWVSDDGLHWDPLPDALRTGDPGRFDDDQLWTMAVQEHAGRFHMLYTALATAEGGRVQRVGHAVSEDLIHWTPDPTPAAVAGGSHYETRAGEGAPWVSFRDPKPVRTPDGFVVAVCARTAEGPRARRGAVAMLRSRDLTSFELDGPIFAPRIDFELECPQLVPIPDAVVLITSMQFDRSVRWFRAPSLRGPFTTPVGNRLLPAPYYAARVFEVDDGLAVAGTYRYVDTRGRTHHVLPPPLRLHFAGPHHVELRSWPPAVARFEPAGPPLVPSTARFGNTSATSSVGRWAVEAGQELWTDDVDGSDGLVSGRVRADAPRFGVAFDVTDDGSAWFCELEPALGQVRLVWRGGSLDRDGAPWFEVRSAQEGTWRPPADVRDHTVALRLHGRGVELSIDEQVVLSAVVDRPLVAPHRIGLWAESGMVEADLMFRRARSGSAD